MNDSQLDLLLKSCGSRETPTRFSSDVWNRIAAEPPRPGILSSWKAFIETAFSRISQPVGAIATFALFVIAGTYMGSRADTHQPETQYIQAISPFILQSER